MFNAIDFSHTIDFLEKENTIIYPPLKDRLKAFQLCKFDELKVVILGQDPYHGANQATTIN